jgi:hypothetical protein
MGVVCFSMAELLCYHMVQGPFFSGSVTFVRLIICFITKQISTVITKQTSTIIMMSEVTSLFHYASMSISRVQLLVLQQLQSDETYAHQACI